MDYVLYALLGFLGIIILLLLIAFIKTIFMKKPVVKKEIEIDYNDALVYANKFKEMIRVKTISYNEETENGLPFQVLKNKMKELFPLVFNTMEIKEFKGESLIHPDESYRCCTSR